MSRTVQKRVIDYISTMLSISKQCIAIASSNSNIHIWNHITKETVNVLKGHAAPVTSLCLLSCPYPRLVSGDEDGVIKIWDMDKGECILTLREHTRAITALIVMPDIGIVSISDDTNIKVWDPVCKNSMLTLTDSLSSFSGIASFGKNKIVTTSNDERIKVWDLKEKKCIYSHKLDLIGNHCLIALSEQHVVCAGLQGGLGILDIVQNKALVNLPTRGREINRLTRLRTGEIVACLNSGDVKILDSQNLQELNHIPFSQCQTAFTELSNGTLAFGSEFGDLFLVSFPFITKNHKPPEKNSLDMDTSEDMLYDQYLSRFG